VATAIRTTQACEAAHKAAGQMSVTRCLREALAKEDPGE
jgi:hypothetical protein